MQTEANGTAPGTAPEPLLIASYSVIDGYAAKVLLMGPVLFDYFANLLRVPLLAPLVWRDAAGVRDCLGRQWRTVLTVATPGCTRGLRQGRA